MDDRKRLEVVGAVIIDEDRIFCTRRGPGNLEGMWEFPGGKIEPGESGPEALTREIREELDCVIKVGDKIALTHYEYPFASVSLTTYRCRLQDGRPRLSEHTQSLWLTAGELDTVDWAPADVPTVLLLAQG